MEDLYYPSSENKGADQLCGYRKADLCLCFCLCRLLVFPDGGSYYTSSVTCSYVHAKSIVLSIEGFK